MLELGRIEKADLCNVSQIDIKALARKLSECGANRMSDCAVPLLQAEKGKGEISAILAKYEKGQSFKLAELSGKVMTLAYGLLAVSPILATVKGMAWESKYCERVGLDLLDTNRRLWERVI